MTYKKNKSRRYTLINREIINAKDIVTRYRIRVVEIKEEKKKRYAKQSKLN